MTVIIDVQGFKLETNEFIVKEIAILYENKIQVLLIKPPFPYHELTRQERRQVNWIQRNRNIYWNEGVVSYSHYQKLITNIARDKCVYTKGLEKVLWLQYILENNNINNLEDQGCPSLLSLFDQYLNCQDLYSCIYHEKVCALRNVLCLKKWCFENKCFT